MGIYVDLLGSNIAIAPGKCAQAIEALYSYECGELDRDDYNLDFLDALLIDFGWRLDPRAVWNERIELWRTSSYWTNWSMDFVLLAGDYIDDGSVIALSSENGDVWRYVYRDGEPHVQGIDLLGEQGWMDDPQQAPSIAFQCNRVVGVGEEEGWPR